MMERTATFRGADPVAPPTPLHHVRLLYTAAHGVTASPATVVPPGGLVLGRASTVAELASMADDKALSRRHAEIVIEGDNAVLRDAGSHNGSFVGGAKVGHAVLRDGDIVRVGGCLLVYRYEPQSATDAALPGLNGRAYALRVARATLAHAATTSATILLLGETGTGKSLAARAVHDSSERRGPLVTVNCAAIPEQLAESQLFGHVAGAFTGARNDAVGFFRAADRGTLFLDEIGDLPLPTQAKLLSAIEDKVVIPVGSFKPIPCDVRVLAATNVDLAQAIATREFRGDLMARLSEIVVRLPPLRERREDVLLLFAAALGSTSVTIDVALAEALLLYAWPYNVREVVKIANEITVLSRSQPELGIPQVLQRLRSATPTTSSAIADTEQSRAAPPSRAELEGLLAATGGVISEVAARTGRSRKQVYRWLEQYGMDAESYR